MAVANDLWFEKDPCDEVDNLATSLSEGLWINLLVRNIDASIAFQTQVFGAEKVYGDPSFAVVRYKSSRWMLHADETYANHPLASSMEPTAIRGLGCEIRLQGCDPDVAVNKAKDAGGHILEPALDKPHGLREAFIQDPDGYLWVPSILKSGI